MYYTYTKRYTYRTHPWHCVCVFRNLRKTESRKNKLEDQLNSVGAKVNELKEKYANFPSLLPAFYSSVSTVFHLWKTLPCHKLPSVFLE